MGTGLRRCGKALGVIGQNCSTRSRRTDSAAVASNRQYRVVAGFGRQRAQGLVISEIMFDRSFVEVDPAEPGGFGDGSLQTIDQRQGLALLG